MKAKELKIGDYFFIENTPVKIKTLADGDISVVKYGEVAPANISDLIPLPLTSEILEKNGWLDGHWCWRLMYLVLVPQDSNTFGFTIDKGDGHSVIVHNIKYIHELQHILWALGIDDDLKI